MTLTTSSTSVIASAVPPVWHVESVLSPSTGRWIRISCHCEIGVDHSYGEWVARHDAGYLTR